MADLNVQHLDMTFTNPQTGAAVQALKDVSFTLKKGGVIVSSGPIGLRENNAAEFGCGLYQPYGRGIETGRYPH